MFLEYSRKQINYNRFDILTYMLSSYNRYVCIGKQSLVVILMCTYICVCVYVYLCVCVCAIFAINVEKYMHLLSAFYRVLNWVCLCIFCYTPVSHLIKRVN